MWFYPVRPLLSLFVHVHRRNRSYSSRGRQWPTKRRNYRKWERKRERERGGFYPSSINDLANGSNVRLVTTLVNRAPPAESALPEKLRVSSSFTSHPTERKKNARDLFYRPSCNVSFPRATILQVPSYSISFARTGSSTSRLKGLDSKGRVIKIRMREFTDTFVGYVRDA